MTRYDEYKATEAPVGRDMVDEDKSRTAGRGSQGLSRDDSGVTAWSRFRLGITTSHEAEHDTKPHSALCYAEEGQQPGHMLWARGPHCTELHVGRAVVLGRLQQRGRALYFARKSYALKLSSGHQTS